MYLSLKTFIGKLFDTQYTFLFLLLSIKKLLLCLCSFNRWMIPHLFLFVVSICYLLTLDLLSLLFTLPIIQSTFHLFFMWMVLIKIEKLFATFNTPSEHILCRGMKYIVFFLIFWWKWDSKISNSAIFLIVWTITY